MSQVEPEQWEQLQQVLQRYKSVGEEPSRLLPIRTTDHHILLQPDAKPINVHPYQYPHFQKMKLNA